MATPEEDKAAKEKADAEAAEAKKKAAESGKPEDDRGPTPEERRLAEDKRNAEEAALKGKLEEADKRITDLDAKIGEMKAKQKSEAEKGKSTDALERRIADAEKVILDLHEREKAAIERANTKTLETDLRKTLDGQLVDSEAMDVALDLLILRKKARVDSDGKVAIVDDKGAWGSLTVEALLKHIPNALKVPKGVPGGGNYGPRGETGVPSTAWEQGKVSQKRFNELVDNKELPSGNSADKLSAAK